VEIEATKKTESKLTATTKKGRYWDQGRACARTGPSEEQRTDKEEKTELGHEKQPERALGPERDVEQRSDPPRLEADSVPRNEKRIGPKSMVDQVCHGDVERGMRTALSKKERKASVSEGKDRNVKKGLERAVGTPKGTGDVLAWKSPSPV